MSELFNGRTGSVTAAVAGKRWMILAIGMPSVNFALPGTFAGASGPPLRTDAR